MLAFCSTQAFRIFQTRKAAAHAHFSDAMISIWLFAFGHRYADKIAPLGPRTVVVLYVLETK